MTGFYLEAALLAVFIAVSAFFAASEVAFLSLSQLKLHSLLKRRVPGVESLARLRFKRRKVVISLLIGGNIANVTASALATSISIGLFGEAGIGIAVGLMSFLLLTFGDIAPKSMATTYGEKIALSFAPAIETFYWFSYPLVVLFEGLNRLIPGVYSRATGIEQFTEEEVRSAVALGAKHKSISEKEKELIENVLEFNDKPVSKAMTPKSKVTVLYYDTPIQEAHRKATFGHYSRMPVLDNQQKVVGAVSIKMLAQAVYEHPDWRVGQVCSKPAVVRTTDKLHNAFASLQAAGKNIAIVLDEKNEFTGIITLEDLLEELVGELE